MCVAGVRAIPLCCSDCYDRANTLEAEPGEHRGSRLGGWARTAQRPGAGGQGWGAWIVHRVSPWRLAQRRHEEWQLSSKQLLSKHLGCCDRPVHQPAPDRGARIIY